MAVHSTQEEGDSKRAQTLKSKSVQMPYEMERRADGEKLLFCLHTVHTVPKIAIILWVNVCVCVRIASISFLFF